jgi:glycosyltransferase involved in cell wall biosynthesis
MKRLVNDPEAIIQTGRISFEQVKLYLSSSDVWWLPLVNSGANQGRFPLKLNDYIAAGKPVVVTEVGDIPDMVKNGNFGLIAKDDPVELANQAHHLLSNPEKMEELGRNARQFSEQECDWKQISEDLSRYYKTILNQ